jgi:hypothetical protein
MDTLSKHYTLKAGSVQAPKEYLGSDIQIFKMYSARTQQVQMSVAIGLISARKYIKGAVTEVNRTLAEVYQQLENKVTTPIAGKYCSELDATPELDSDRITYCQGLISVLQWIIDFG